MSQYAPNQVLDNLNSIQNVGTTQASTALQMSSEIDDARNRRKAIIKDYYQGKESLHASYPDEHEYYAFALELCNVDTNGLESTEKYLMFPTMPESIMRGKQYLGSIKKTATGVDVIRNSSFQPFEIQIQGNFGRKFRYVDTKGTLTDAQLSTSIAFTTEDPSSNQLQQVNVNANKVFAKGVKTGYGTTKLLQQIIDLSFIPYLDIPRRLYLYNYAFNDIFLVEPISLRFNQNKSTNNMMWGYDLSVKALCPASAIKGNLKDSTQQKLGVAKMVNKVNASGQSIQTIFKNQVTDRFFDSINSTQGGQLVESIYKYGGNVNANDLDDIAKSTSVNTINKF